MAMTCNDQKVININLLTVSSLCKSYMATISKLMRQSSETSVSLWSNWLTHSHWSHYPQSICSWGIQLTPVSQSMTHLWLVTTCHWQRWFSQLFMFLTKNPFNPYTGGQSHTSKASEVKEVYSASAEHIRLGRPEAPLWQYYAILHQHT